MERETSRWHFIGYYCEVLGLTIWVGGLVMVIAVVIPAVFNSFGMEPAGRFLRRVFDGYSLFTLGILLFLLVMAAVRYWAERTSSHVLFTLTRTEVFLLLGMIVTTTLIMGVLGPKAVALQEQAFETIGQAEKKIAYDQFFRIHMIVRALHLINVGLATGLLISKLRRGIQLSLVYREQLRNV